jgi:hypothetical protein
MVGDWFWCSREEMRESVVLVMVRLGWIGSS